MKIIIIVIFLASLGTVSLAQDTAYISRDKTTALFFPSPVTIISKEPAYFTVVQKGSGLITLKAISADFNSEILDVQNDATKQVYHIPVRYSYGRAGRKIEYGEERTVIAVIKTPANNYPAVADLLASGKRSAIASHKKAGGIKAWVNKLSLAGNQVFFRLDIQNRSNLPYDIDFIRFYIRDRKTVGRMATHEQEIVPVYATLDKHTSIFKSKETKNIFAFRRFSLAEDQALNVEIYERNGNRHLCLRIKRKDLENLKAINSPEQQVGTVAANEL
jgi:hypothetical protein